MGISGTGDACRCNRAVKNTNQEIETSSAAPKPKGKKMKVLKKIKRRMGLVSRSTSLGGGTNNLPPLLFHNVHGDNVRISREGTVARRVESFCKGIAFSARPVKVNEKVCVKFLDVSDNWSGVIRFGFTYNDPSTLRYGLPKYACPDLTNKPGYWAKALPERFCSQNTILFYYVNSAGDVHFGINGEEKGIFFSGVETRGPLWVLIDVYGNSTAVAFLDIRHQLNNNRRNVSCAEEDVERIVYPMQQISIQQMRENEEASLPPLRHQPSSTNFVPLSFHRTHGRNVKFNSNRGVASRSETEFCQGYVFTPRPIQLGERIVIQILATEPMFQGCLGLGLTSCDPTTLQNTDLPDDCNFLLDRPEYWVISRDFARHLNRGDEISFCIAPNGEVQISRNGGLPSVVIHVDQTLRLWAFFDIYGSTQRIRVLTSPSPGSTPTRNPERRILSSPLTSEASNNINTQSDLHRNSGRVCCVTSPGEGVVNGGTVFSVILPPAHAANLMNQQTLARSHHSSQNSVNSQNSSNGHASHFGTPIGTPVAATITPAPVQHVTTTPVTIAAQPTSTGTMLSNYSNTYIEPISGNTLPHPTLPMRGDHDRIPTLPGTGTECTICYEHPIDSVLYMCGHMCMCYECALQQWRGKGGGHCPLCRAVIRDVIRTYKS